MEVLDLYKKHHPDLFARLPLPKDIAEKYGTPISDEIMPLKVYLGKHLSLRTANYNEYEEKVACTIVPKSQTASEDQQEKPQSSEDSKEASETKIPESESQSSSNPPPSQSDERCITLSV